MQPKYLQLVGVGAPPPGLLKELEEPLLTQLGVTATLGKKVLAAPAYAFNKDRQQYHCNAIMRRLSAVLEPGQQFVLGVSEVDLFVPDAPFVFGEADRESKVGVISVFRLRQGADADALRRRAQVEAVHQAGHLVGLSFCEDPRCVMFLGTTLQDCDRKSLALCNLCRNELNKQNR